MNGDGLVFSQAKIREILKTEFLIPENILELRSIEHVAAALKVYGSIEEFLERTGWGRDNPECSSEEYLIGNRICRWVDGKLFYFSRLVWENGDCGQKGEMYI